MLSEVLMQEKIPDKTPMERFSRNNGPPIRIYPGKTSGETVVGLTARRGDGVPRSSKKRRYAFARRVRGRADGASYPARHLLHKLSRVRTHPCPARPRAQSGACHHAVSDRGARW